jgi:NAD(P)-dependent dehydrogenase (short-subunit alcohol dehydrogenase family)
MQSTPKKIALITGANKGIGFEVARQLAASGCTVLLGARNPALGQEAASKLQREFSQDAVRYLAVDLEDSATIAGAAQAIDADFGRLDILVNNAGIAAPGDGLPSSCSLDTIERDFRVNFLGSVAVTQAMLPLLRKAPSANIVNVSSGLGSITKSGDPTWTHVASKFLGYAASKAALNMLTVQLAYELRDTSIKVNSVDPGYTATDLNRHTGTQTIPEGAAEVIRQALLPDNGPSGIFSNTRGIVPW